MGRYRKIDSRIWNDPAFRLLWDQRWTEPSRVPKHHPYPFINPLPEREALCLYLRHRFAKLRPRLMPVVTARLGRKCLICRKAPAVTLDHVIPIRWGGTNDEVNFQPVCTPCNSRKGGLLPEPPTTREVI